MKYDALIFDLDGTLWDVTPAILDAWKEVLAGHPEIEGEVTAEMLAATFGKQPPEIAKCYFPDLPFEIAMGLMDECGIKENEILSHLDGFTYTGVIETLKRLKEKMPLFIVSNCHCGYIESFLEGHHTADLFTDFECAGGTGLSKGENIRLVMERNHLTHPAYVGDTQSDADAAAQAGIPVIYAAYGFGDIREYAEKLTDFKDLLHMIED